MCSHTNPRTHPHSTESARLSSGAARAAAPKAVRVRACNIRQRESDCCAAYTLMQHVKLLVIMLEDHLQYPTVRLNHTVAHMRPRRHRNCAQPSHISGGPCACGAHATYTRDGVYGSPEPETGNMCANAQQTTDDLPETTCDERPRPLAHAVARSVVGRRA